jgi:hypothetical protein
LINLTPLVPLSLRGIKGEGEEKEKRGFTPLRRPATIRKMSFQRRLESSSTSPPVSPSLLEREGEEKEKRGFTPLRHPVDNKQES